MDQTNFNETQKRFPTCSEEQVTALVETRLGGTENYWTSCRNNATNSWYVNSNGNVNNTNSYNSYVIIPIVDFCDKLLEAEDKCWKNKHKSVDAAKHHFHLSWIIDLAYQLQQGTYKPGTAQCFVVAYPVWREIFASSYYDRVVHHLVAPYINYVAERVHRKNGSISHGNRKKHSAQYGAQRIRKNIKDMSKDYTQQLYVSTNDFSGFFMSINRRKAFRAFAYFFKKYKPPGLSNEWHLFYLTVIRQLILHDPTKDYIKISPEESWNNVPDRKSMFHSKPGHGLPIGNFYSQLIANLFLGCIDEYLHSIPFIRVQRFVDDVFICARYPKTLIWARKKLISLANQYGLKISPNKFYIQPYQNGIKFCGRVIKSKRIYLINRTVNACIRKVYQLQNNQKSLVQSVNSYFGLMSKCNEFNAQKE